jgi:non-ribosomal peptide synthetase component E (peptide arylation enzyme)
MGNTLLTLLSAELIKQYYAAGHWRDDTIFSLVRDHARRAPQKPALRDRFRRVDFATLVEAVDTLAADLAACGVKPGERVAVWLPSRIESVIALLACSRNGYVCCPSLHRDHTAAEILELLRRTRATAFIRRSAPRRRARRRDGAWRDPRCAPDRCCGCRG